MALTPAQLRAYQQICDPSGRMLVVAMDQRASMRALIESTAGEATTADLVAAKLDLVRYLGNEAPAVLLDPELVVPQVIVDAVLAPDCALMIGLMRRDTTPTRTASASAALWKASTHGVSDSLGGRSPS